MGDFMRVYSTIPYSLALPPAAEGSAAVAGRVLTARARQAKGYAGLAAGRTIRTNAEADGALLDAIANEPAGRARAPHSRDGGFASRRAATIEC